MLEIEIQSEEVWEAVLEEVKERGAAMFANDGQSGLQALMDVEVSFTGPDGELARTEARVIFLDPQHIALSFSEEAKAALTKPDEREKRPAAGSADDSQPLWARYDKLPKTEKIKLARHGNAEARRMVLRDRDQTLHGFILNNPGLTVRELATLIRTGGVNRQFFERIGQRGDLLGNPTIVEALVTNPLTPLKMAVSLVPRLQKEVVRRISKAGNLRAEIVKAARRRVLRK